VGDFTTLFLMSVIIGTGRFKNKQNELQALKKQATELGYARYETDGKTIQFIWNKPNDLNEPNNPKGEIE